MPRYFDRFGRHEPSDRQQSPIALYENKLGSTVFDIFHADPSRRDAFMTVMAAFEPLVPALGTYDLSWAVAHASTTPDRVLLIDVGGGKGQALVHMFRSTPGLPRHRCMLQDLPETIEAAKRDRAPELRDVQMLAVDFHREQPVKGAPPFLCSYDFLSLTGRVQAPWSTTCGGACTTTQPLRASPCCRSSRRPWRATAGCSSPSCCSATRRRPRWRRSIC